MLDITAPKSVEIHISQDGRIWVNTDEGCVLRIHGAESITLRDYTVKKLGLASRYRDYKLFIPKKRRKTVRVK